MPDTLEVRRGATEHEQMPAVRIARSIANSAKPSACACRYGRRPAAKTPRAVWAGIIAAACPSPTPSSGADTVEASTGPGNPTSARRWELDLDYAGLSGHGEGYSCSGLCSDVNRGL